MLSSRCACIKSLGCSSLRCCCVVSCCFVVCLVARLWCCAGVVSQRWCAAVLCAKKHTLAKLSSLCPAPMTPPSVANWLVMFVLSRSCHEAILPGVSCGFRSLRALPSFVIERSHHRDVQFGYCVRTIETIQRALPCLLLGVAIHVVQVRRLCAV